MYILAKDLLDYTPGRCIGYAKNATWVDNHETRYVADGYAVLDGSCTREKKSL